MRHARADYDRIQDPDGEIPDGEPVFLLRAQDAAAPEAVEYWADFAEKIGADEDIIQTAREHAEAMRQWQDDHGNKIPDM